MNIQAASFCGAKTDRQALLCRHDAMVLCAEIWQNLLKIEAADQVEDNDEYDDLFEQIIALETEYTFTETELPRMRSQ